MANTPSFCYKNKVLRRSVEITRVLQLFEGITFTQLLDSYALA
jgi:hypothetical protein